MPKEVAEYKGMLTAKDAIVEAMKVYAG